MINFPFCRRFSLAIAARELSKQTDRQQIFYQLDNRPIFFFSLYPFSLPAMLFPRVLPRTRTRAHLKIEFLVNGSEIGIFLSGAIPPTKALCHGERYHGQNAATVFVNPLKYAERERERERNTRVFVAL